MPNAKRQKLLVIYENGLHGRNQKGVIVSPLSSSACCFRDMAFVGKEMVDSMTGYRFILKRCSTCGYTVRYFPRPKHWRGPET